jgi:hypothetical protein
MTGGCAAAKAFDIHIAEFCVWCLTAVKNSIWGLCFWVVLNYRPGYCKCQAVFHFWGNVVPHDTDTLASKQNKCIMSFAFGV